MFYGRWLAFRRINPGLLAVLTAGLHQNECVKWPPSWRHISSAVTWLYIQLENHQNRKPSTSKTSIKQPPKSEPSLSNMATTTDSNADVTSSPVIYASPSFGSPDACITVFNKGFHVHSQILQEYIPFFRKFLTSADKAGQPLPASGFKYDWITKVDEDGKGWGPVNNDSKVCSHSACVLSLLGPFDRIRLTSSCRPNHSTCLSLLEAAHKKRTYSRSFSTQHIVFHSRLDLSRN